MLSLRLHVDATCMWTRVAIERGMTFRRDDSRSSFAALRQREKLTVVISSVLLDYIVIVVISILYINVVFTIPSVHLSFVHR